MLELGDLIRSVVVIDSVLPTQTSIIQGKIMTGF